MKETTVPQQQQTAPPETRDESRTLTPPVDIFEVEDGLAVIVDLPGVAKEDVDVRVENDVLTLSGKTKAVLPDTAIYTEFQLANFFRQFQLSERVDQEKIRAEAKNGVLTINLPKAEKAKPKKIAVQVS